MTIGCLSSIVPFGGRETALSTFTMYQHLLAVGSNEYTALYVIQTQRTSFIHLSPVRCAAIFHHGLVVDLVAGSNVSSEFSSSAGTRRWPPELTDHFTVLGQCFLRNTAVMEICFSVHTSAPVRLGVARPTSGALFAVQAHCQYSSPKPNHAHPHRQIPRGMQ